MILPATSVPRVVPTVVRVKCHYCSRFWHPRELLDIGQGGAKMCFQCHEWHVRSIEAFAKGAPPPGCFGCRRTWSELRLTVSAGDNPDDVKMFFVPKDGIYQLLCRTCSDAYELERADLLKGTQYGQSKGIV